MVECEAYPEWAVERDVDPSSDLPAETTVVGIPCAAGGQGGADPEVDAGLPEQQLPERADPAERNRNPGSGVQGQKAGVDQEQTDVLLLCVSAQLDRCREPARGVPGALYEPPGGISVDNLPARDRERTGLLRDRAVRRHSQPAQTGCSQGPDTPAEPPRSWRG